VRILLASMPGCVDFIDAHVKLPNLAIASIAGSLPDHEVALMDMVMLKPKVKKPFMDFLAEFKPHLVGLSAMTFQFSSLLRVAKLVKEYDPSIKIVAGGYHATLMHEEIDRNELSRNLDFLVRGEGEESMAELVAQLETPNADFSGVLGISYRNENGSWNHNGPRDLRNLSTLPLPQRNARITKGYHFMGMPMDVVETSRGCPFNCKFCSITHMYGHTFRAFPLDRVIADISKASLLGAKSIFFIDDNLTYDVEHFKALCQAIVDNGLNNILFMTQVSAIGIAKHPDLVEYMDKANFRIVFVGFESMDPDFLKKMNKPTNPDINMTAARLLKNHNMGVIVGSIVGYPDDDEESVKRSIWLTKQLKGDALYLQYLTPYPKTRIRDELQSLGLITNEDNFDQYTGMECNIRTKHLSRDDLQRCKRVSMLRSEGQVAATGMLNNFFVKNFKWNFIRELIFTSLPLDIFYLLFDRKPFKEYDI
jgi:anaerobic magnesium-protoporphyrin IX monomethyl ester cyclase